MKQGEGIVSANRAYFDSIAEKYDVEKPSAIELAKRLATVFRKAYPFQEEETRVMDFACGTGLISRYLAPYCRSIVGVDISAKMVERYNQVCWEHGIEEDEMRGICVDLQLHNVPQGSSSLEEREPRQDIGKFDVIVAGAAFHHIPDIGEMSKALKAHLKENGWLLVADVEKGQIDVTEKEEMREEEDVLHPSESPRLVAHPGGFTRTEMEHAFVKCATLDNFDFRVCLKAKQHGRQAQIFLAMGQNKGSPRPLK